MARITYSSKASPAAGSIGERSSPPRKTRKEVPIFQYYKYATEAVLESPVRLEHADTKTPLGTGTEKNSAHPKPPPTRVRSGQLHGARAHGSQAKARGRVANLTNQITFALQAPNPEATIQAAPCE